MSTPYVKQDHGDLRYFYVPNRKFPKNIDTYLRFKYVSREKWGAFPPAVPGYPLEKMSPLPNLVVAHTESDPCYGLKECSRLLRKLQKRHVEKEGLPDIKYNWIIGEDGRIYEGAGWSTAVYWATPAHNPYIYNSITVAFTDPISVEDQMGYVETGFQRLLVEGIGKQHLDCPLEEQRMY